MSKEVGAPGNAAVKVGRSVESHAVEVLTLCGEHDQRRQRTHYECCVLFVSLSICLPQLHVSPLACVMVASRFLSPLDCDPGPQRCCLVHRGLRTWQAMALLAAVLRPSGGTTPPRPAGSMHGCGRRGLHGSFYGMDCLGWVSIRDLHARPRTSVSSSDGCAPSLCSLASVSTMSRSTSSTEGSGTSNLSLYLTSS